ncbi:hypothetical protein FGB62_42g11 [Gracilaria domingensis]|nr:hypothetical protein FGB62_42g11 [Gracilaria domingensis]
MRSASTRALSRLPSEGLDDTHRSWLAAHQHAPLAEAKGAWMTGLCPPRSQCVWVAAVTSSDATARSAAARSPRSRQTVRIGSSGNGGHLRDGGYLRDRHRHHVPWSRTPSR